MKMQPATLRYANLLLFTLLVGISCLATVAWLDITPLNLPQEARTRAPALPYSFSPDQNSLLSVGPPLFILEKNDIKLSIPDLRNVLMYYGTNVRPDVSEKASVVQMGIRGNPLPLAVTTKSPVYLRYEAKGNSGKWFFSENNAPTATSIELSPLENSVEVHVCMTDSEGNQISEPLEFSVFSLPQMHMPYNAQAQGAFEIGGLRVDGSLLIRQKAAWFGQDLFLQEYGGDEYAFSRNTERIEFLDPENRYVCYAGPGDCLAYYEGRWHEVEAGPNSRDKPLLVVRKVDDRGIGFDLWDASGKARISLELHKAHIPQNFASKFDIKLVGARSRRDWIAELGGERMLLRTDDWLIQQPDGWKKISTPEDLDDFVCGTIRGTLLVIEGTEKSGNDSGLVASLFDETRTQKVPLKISLFKSWEQSNETAEADDEDEEEEFEDDDDDDEDDDIDVDEDDDLDDEDDEDDLV